MSFFSWLCVSGMTITRAVAERVGDQRQADAGVAGRAFDDHAARPQQPARFGVAHDVQRGAVLHRPARVEELALAEDLAAGLLGGLAQAHQRRVADQIDEAAAHLHGRRGGPSTRVKAPAN